jgi:hypothetical protein
MEDLIQYMTMTNGITALVVLVILYSLKKIVSGDIGVNKFGYFFLFVSLGAGLYLWRSGTVMGFVTNIQGAM